MAISVADQKKLDLATAIVGENALSNISVFAGKFAQMHIEPLQRHLPSSAPLIACLERPLIKQCVDDYFTANKNAISQQAAFKRLSLRVMWPFLLALVLSLVSVVVPLRVLAEGLATWVARNESYADPIERGVRLGLPWAIYLCLILTPILVAWLKPTRAYITWQEQRAKAEAMRTEWFRRVFNKDEKPLERLDAWDLLLRLEYFRRWQVQVQQTYFKRRGDQHRAKLKWAEGWWWVYLMACIVLLAVLVATLAVSWDEQGYITGCYVWVGEVFARVSFIETLGFDYWGGVVALLAALAFVSWWVDAKLSASRRDAPRYANMGNNFKELTGKMLIEARLAAVVGDEDKVRRYVERVHSIMSFEQADWVRLGDLERGIDKGLPQITGPDVV